MTIVYEMDKFRGDFQEYETPNTECSYEERRKLMKHILVNHWHKDNPKTDEWIENYLDEHIKGD